MVMKTFNREPSAAGRPHAFWTKFRHTPEAKVRGVRRWPTGNEMQAFPTQQRPTMDTVLVWVWEFLQPSDRNNVMSTHPAFQAGGLYLPLWITRPWSPYRRRRWGFGKTSRTRSCTHDKPNPKCIIHHIWTFCTWQERKTLTKTCKTWFLYAHLRRRATTFNIAHLRRLREGKQGERLQDARAIAHTCALMRFDFNHGDLIRWMGGEYTNRSRNWTSEWTKIMEAVQRPLPPDYPPPDYHRTFRTDTEGVPLLATYCTPHDETIRRDIYDNHPAVADNLDKVQAKFAKEEHRSYHMHFLRFVVPLIYGLIINPIQWAFDKGKGRICIDCTNGPNPEGSVNTHIPRTCATGGGTTLQGCTYSHESLPIAYTGVQKPRSGRLESPRKVIRRNTYPSKRYEHMVPATTLQGLPTALQANIQNSVHRFLTEDRGNVRANNDRTFESRCNFFRDWCATQELTKHHLSDSSDEVLILLVGNYLQQLKDGNTITGTQIQGNTLSNYLAAAKTELELLTGRRLPFKEGTLWIPYFRELIQSRKRFQRPKPRKEPITEEIFHWLHQDTFARTKQEYLEKQWAVYDWLRLGIFTGSRVGEYAQAKLKRGQRFNVVPSTLDVPAEFRGSPLAFIGADFEFYDHDQRQIPNHLAKQEYLQGRVAYLRLRYRYDKSPTNFSYRKYENTNHVIFNPVGAAVDIIDRANILGVAANEPIGVFWSPKTRYRFLHDSDVTEVLRNACVQAYPDPNHYLRVNIKCLVPHSNRVTAAVCMQQGGASHEEIAFRLRWHITSVPTYLRDCFKAVGASLMKTLNGALINPQDG